MRKILFSVLCFSVLLVGVSVRAQTVVETHVFNSLSVNIPSSWEKIASDDPYDNELAYFEHFIGVSLRVISIDQGTAEALYGDYSPEVIFSRLETIDSEPINGITRGFKVQDDGLYIYYVGDSQLLTLIIHASDPDQLADINMYYDLPIIADSVRGTGSEPDEDYYGFKLENATLVYQRQIRETLENRVDKGVTETTSGIRLTELAAIMPRGNAINYPGVGLDIDFTRVYTISDVLQRYDIAGWHETAASIRDAVDNGSLLGVSVKSWGSPTCNPSRFEVSVWLFNEVSDAEDFAISGDLEKAWDQDGVTGEEANFQCGNLLKHAVIDQSGQFVVTARVVYNDEGTLEQFETDLNRLIDTVWEKIDVAEF